MLIGAARKAYDAARRPFRKAYEKSRNARKHDVKPVVLRVPRAKKFDWTAPVAPRQQVRLHVVKDLPPKESWRPKERGDCIDGIRPCPYVSCRHHLYLDVNPITGSIKLNRPDLKPHEMADSCSLDVADEGGTTLDSVAAALNITRERVRQIEDEACKRIRPMLERWSNNPDKPAR